MPLIETMIKSGTIGSKSSKIEVKGTKRLPLSNGRGFFFEM